MHSHNDSLILVIRVPSSLKLNCHKLYNLFGVVCKLENVRGICYFVVIATVQTQNRKWQFSYPEKAIVFSLVG